MFSILNFNIYSFLRYILKNAKNTKSLVKTASKFTKVLKGKFLGARLKGEQL